MESRPTEEQTYAAEPIDLLAELPEEMKLHIFSFLNTTSDLGRVQELNRHYHRVVNTNNFWITKFRKRHGTIPILANAKNQFLAADLQCFADTLRIDQQQIHLKNNYRFIRLFQAESWTLYYQGVAAFFGRGVKKDTEAGFKLLMRGFESGDHRTAFAITCILLDTKANDLALFGTLSTLLGVEGINRLIERLFYIHNKKIMTMNYLIGRLFVYGLGVERSFELAEPYFLKTISITETGLADLAYFKLESAANAADYEKNVLDTIKYIKTLGERYKPLSVDNLVNYYSAYLELFRENRTEAVRLLLKAPNYGPAKIALSTIYIDQQQLNAAANQLIDVINAGDTSVAGQLFDVFAQLEPLTEAIKLIRDAAPDRMSDIATKVSAKYRQEFTSEDWCMDGVIVWWLQFAAQCGCEASLHALLAVNAKKYSNICCALGIIYEFGIMNSSILEANHDKAEYYFYLARKTYALEIETYLLLGIGEGLACQEVINLLHGQTTQASHVATSLAK